VLGLLDFEHDALYAFLERLVSPSLKSIEETLDISSLTARKLGEARRYVVGTPA
jgi:hypothetical protein